MGAKDTGLETVDDDSMNSEGRGNDSRSSEVLSTIL